MLVDFLRPTTLLPEFMRTSLQRLKQEFKITTRLTLGDIEKGADDGCSLFANLIARDTIHPEDVDPHRKVGIRLRRSDDFGVSAIRFVREKYIVPRQLEQPLPRTYIVYDAYTLEGLLLLVFVSS
jgi:hypothetical protein